MKRTVALALLGLVLAAPLHAQVVRGNTAECDESVNDAACALAPITVNAGSTIAVGCYNNSSGATMSSVSDGTNTYSLVSSNNSQSPSMFLYRAKNVSAGTFTITATFGAAEFYKTCLAVEYRNSDQTEPNDVTGNDNAAGAASDLTSDAFSTSDAQEVVVMIGGEQVCSTMTAGTDFTMVDGEVGTLTCGSKGLMGFEERITSSTLSSYTAHMTSDASTPFTTALGSFKAAGTVIRSVVIGGGLF